jgi:hypothetical protein
MDNKPDFRGTDRSVPFSRGTDKVRTPQTLSQLAFSAFVRTVRTFLAVLTGRKKLREKLLFKNSPHY